MLIVSQCGAGVFNADSFVAAWVKSYDNKDFLLEAVFRNREVVLGIFDSEGKALSALDDLVNQLKYDRQDSIYQI